MVKALIERVWLQGSQQLKRGHFLILNAELLALTIITKAIDLPTMISEMTILHSHDGFTLDGSLTAVIQQK